MDCKFCNKPLNEAQYKRGKTLKSCPRCSVSNGDYHVYYAYPSTFGTTLKRSTRNSPEGAQSYCTACRGDQEVVLTPIVCCDV